MSVAEFAQLLTAFAVAGNCAISYRNSRKIDVVHRTTNSLAQRNEAIARELGVAEGKKSEKDNPS